MDCLKKVLENLHMKTGSRMKGPRRKAQDGHRGAVSLTARALCATLDADMKMPLP